MAQGFGVRQSKKQKSGKSKAKQRQSKQPAAQPGTPEALQEIEAFLEQDMKDNPELYALAWEAGVFNPLGGDPLEHQARSLEPVEEDWLFMAHQVGWLKVTDELNAIYFTAPPPRFDPAKADWYLRPDLTTFLEEPIPLRTAIYQCPIPARLMKAALQERAKPLGWSQAKLDAFIQEKTGCPSAEMTSAEYIVALMELEALLE